MPSITRIALYVRDMPKIAAFYEVHFGFKKSPASLADKFILTSPDGGCAIVLLHGQYRTRSTSNRL